MKIFSLKNNLYNNNEYISNAYYNPNVVGIIFDVVMTKDKKIVVYPEATSSFIGIESIQNNTLKDIKESEIELLETYLKNLGDFKKRILLNIIPIEHPVLTDYTAETVFSQNNAYMDELLRLVNNYEHSCDISLMTYDANLLNILKAKAKNKKLGWFIISGNNNYIDLDMYIFLSSMLDDTILTQQLDNKKEIMVYITDSNSINTFLNFFKSKETNPIKQRIFEEISIITYYPDIFINAYHQ